MRFIQQDIDSRSAPLFHLVQICGMSYIPQGLDWCNEYPFVLQGIVWWSVPLTCRIRIGGVSHISAVSRLVECPFIRQGLDWWSVPLSCRVFGVPLYPARSRLVECPFYPAGYISWSVPLSCRVKFGGVSLYPAGPRLFLE
jgi:hypothetical protein